MEIRRLTNKVRRRALTWPTQHSRSGMRTASIEVRWRTDGATNRPANRWRREPTGLLALASFRFFLVPKEARKRKRTRKGMEMGAGASSQGVLLGGDTRYGNGL